MQAGHELMDASSARYNGVSSIKDLRCVLVYDEPSFGTRGRRFAESLARICQKRCDCGSVSRRELLQVQEIGTLVAQDAAQADVVIFALRDGQLSPAFKRWLETWLHSAKKSGFSLVALFEPMASSADRPQDARAYLREMCRQRGVAFFAYSPSPSDPPPLSLERQLPESLPPAPHRLMQAPSELRGNPESSRQHSPALSFTSSPSRSASR